MAITTLMSVGGSKRSLRHWLNALFALVTPLGVLLFYLGANQFAEANRVFLGSALAFVTGTFLCIACSDLLPELQFHSHDRLKLSAALLAGLGVAVLIGVLEASSQEAPRSDWKPGRGINRVLESRLWRRLRAPEPWPSARLVASRSGCGVLGCFRLRATRGPGSGAQRGHKNTAARTGIPVRIAVEARPVGG
jgi:hypothetical protein